MNFAIHHDSNSTFAANEFTELVRGNEQRLIERFRHLVTRQNVTLDLETVERIDAAGLAALITLYCDACKAGHRFAIANPAPHVQEILALVGLDKLLLSRNEDGFSYSGNCLQESAA